jgi:alkaline phosphatase D
MSNPNFPLFFGPLAAGPLIGEQGEDDAFIWAQAKTSTPLTLTVFPPNMPSTFSWTVTPRADEFFCVVFHATRLTFPGTYEYELSSELGKTPRFKLRRPPRNDAKRLRIVYGSCIQHPNKADTILKRMADENADLLMLIGDNTYFQEGKDGDPNDWDTEPLMMAAHLRWRGADGMRELCGNTPTLAIWDDHDFGSNDIDGTNPRKGEALRCFKRMWAQRHYGIPGTHGIFSSVRCGPAQVFLLDVRFFREEKTNVIAPGQMQWLMDSLRASDAPVKLIVSGSQILPTAAAEPPRNWESWEERWEGSAERTANLSCRSCDQWRGVHHGRCSPWSVNVYTRGWTRRRAPWRRRLGAYFEPVDRTDGSREGR